MGIKFVIKWEIKEKASKYNPTKHHICTANQSMEKTNLGIDYAWIF